jgi:hypothetical protein
MLHAWPGLSCKSNSPIARGNSGRTSPQNTRLAHIPTPPNRTYPQGHAFGLTRFASQIAFLKLKPKTSSFQLRIPTKEATLSGAKTPPVPIQKGQPFQSNEASRYGY